TEEASRLVDALSNALKTALPGFNPSDLGKLRRLKAIRQGVSFDLTVYASAGTEMAVTLVGPIVAALARGGVLVIDEFNARLHTLLAKQLLGLFHDRSTNPNAAQLIFTSHDTNLLTRTLLRR